MNYFIIFLLGAWAGCIVGVCIMCLLQFNRMSKQERLNQKHSIGYLNYCKYRYESPVKQLMKIKSEIKELEDIIQNINSFNIDMKNHVCEECLDVIVACLTLLKSNFNDKEINCMVTYVNCKNKRRGYY